MSLPLTDFRCGLPEETNLWLDIEAARTGGDKTDIVREILRKWAKGQAHGHSVAQKHLKAQQIKLESTGDESGE